MKRGRYLYLGVGLALIGSMAIRTFSLRNSAGRRTPSARVLEGTGTPSNEVRVQVATAYAHLPLQFEANDGQTDSQVKFLARGIGHTLFLTAREAVLVLTKPDSAPKAQRTQRAGTTGLALRMTFVGANTGARLVGLEELPGKANYFIGRDATQWHTNVPLYAKVSYRDLYPGIDLSYTGDHRTLAYGFVVRAGADPGRIVLGWLGVDSLAVDAQGDLLLFTAVGLVVERKPLIYEEVDGARREVAGGYVLVGARQVGFQVVAHDVSRPLVIQGGAPLYLRPPILAAMRVPGAFDPGHASISQTR